MQSIVTHKTRDTWTLSEVGRDYLKTSKINFIYFFFFFFHLPFYAAKRFSKCSFINDSCCFSNSKSLLQTLLGNTIYPSFSCSFSGRVSRILMVISLNSWQIVLHSNMVTKPSQSLLFYIFQQGGVPMAFLMSAFIIISLTFIDNCYQASHLACFYLSFLRIIQRPGLALVTQS